MEKSRKIYRLKGLEASELVDWHLNYMQWGMLDNAEYTEIPKVGFNIAANVPVGTETASTQKKKTSVLKDKYTHLIHTIINRTFESGGRNHTITLNSTVMQTVYGRDYHRLLKVLTLRNILCILEDNYYSIASKSYEYVLNPSLGITYTLEHSTFLETYYLKMKKAMKKYNTAIENDNKATLNDNKFYERYNASLRLLKMPYIDEARTFISLHNFTNQDSKHYYDYITDKYAYSDFSIIQIDKNNRIYHIGTQTPRLLKPFLNIKYSCDIHNSHPLLFNYIIYQYFNIPQSVICQINQIFLNNNIPSHNVSKLVRKLLIDNGIERDKIANIPADILAYIYLTSKGVFWDSIIDDDICKANTLLRSDIKVLMFAEVFYSKKLTARGKEYAKLFYSKFPSIRKVIKAEKAEDRKRLANEMMRIESELFHKILTRLYNKRYKVISIHDAIIVLNVKANNDCTVELVSQIIKEVYAEKGLLPDVSIDYYGQEYMEKVLVNEQRLNGMISTYLKELGERASSGDAVSAEVLTDIQNAKYELVFNSDCTYIVLHPVNFRFTK